MPTRARDPWWSATEPTWWSRAGRWGPPAPIFFAKKKKKKPKDKKQLCEGIGVLEKTSPPWLPATPQDHPATQLDRPRPSPESGARRRRLG